MSVIGHDEDLIERVAKALAETEFSETRDFSWDDMPDESTVIVSRNDFRIYAREVCYPPHNPEKEE
jgi:hypothetical protein